VAAPIVEPSGALTAVLVGSRRKLGFTRAQITAFAQAAVEMADLISAHVPPQAAVASRAQPARSARGAGRAPAGVAAPPAAAAQEPSGGH
jgi:hypothetical protein